MATATATYHTGLNPLTGIHRDERADRVATAKGERCGSRPASRPLATPSDLVSDWIAS